MTKIFSYPLLMALMVSFHFIISSHAVGAEDKTCDTVLHLAWRGSTTGHFDRSRYTIPWYIGAMCIDSDKKLMMFWHDYDFEAGASLRYDVNKINEKPISYLKAGLHDDLRDKADGTWNDFGYPGIYALSGSSYFLEFLIHYLSDEIDLAVIRTEHNAKPNMKWIPEFKINYPLNDNNAWEKRRKYFFDPATLRPIPIELEN